MGGNGKEAVQGDGEGAGSFEHDVGANGDELDFLDS